MSYQLVIDPVAVDEIEDARTWYDGQRAALGDEFVDAVNAKLARLRTQPLAHALIFRRLRRSLVDRFPYAILYRVEGQTVTVVAVHHTSRDPSGWRSRA